MASSKRLPILLGLALCACVAWCVWTIWSQIRENTQAAGQQAARQAALAAERDRLKGLLELAPCEAKAKAAKVSDVIPDSSARRGGSVGATSAVAASPEEVEDACVFLVSTDGKGHVYTGSGFFVAPGFVLTNRHVVDHAVGKILVTSKSLGEPVIGSIAAQAPEGTLDCALIAIPMPAGSRASVLKFAPDVKKTEKVGAWGFPDLVGKNDPAYASLLKEGNVRAVPELSYTEGVVSAILERRPKLLVHTAPISPGNSGGPLVNAQGEVTGINTLITLDEDSYRQASIAIAGDDVRQFLKAHGIEPAK